jgi:hypothetical protein
VNALLVGEKNGKRTGKRSSTVVNDAVEIARRTNQSNLKDIKEYETTLHHSRRK